MNGSAGNLTFKQTGGQTIVSEKVTQGKLKSIAVEGVANQAVTNIALVSAVRR